MSVSVAQVLISDFKLSSVSVREHDVLPTCIHFLLIMLFSFQYTDLVPFLNLFLGFTQIPSVSLFYF